MTVVTTSIEGLLKRFIQKPKTWATAYLLNYGEPQKDPVFINICGIIEKAKLFQKAVMPKFFPIRQFSTILGTKLLKAFGEDTQIPTGKARNGYFYYFY